MLLNQPDNAMRFETCIPQDGGSPPLSTTGRLVVRIKDVNDMPPKFTKENYMTRVIGEKPLLVNKGLWVLW